MIDTLQPPASLDSIVSRVEAGSVFIYEKASLSISSSYFLAIIFRVEKPDGRSDGAFAFSGRKVRTPQGEVFWRKAGTVSV